MPSPSSHPTKPHSLSRRSFLQIGAFGLGGLTLPQLLKADAAAGGRSSQKSVILIYLVGGPPHQDMFDLKPNAPREIAGPWRPTATNVNGIQICEAFPRLARMMTKSRFSTLWMLFQVFCEMTPWWAEMSRPKTRCARADEARLARAASATPTAIDR